MSTIEKHEADTSFPELFLMSTEVCQLQITEGSPMSTIEKHIPFLSQIFGDRQTTPAHNRTAHIWE